MLKKVLLITGAVIALAVAGSADIPVPPCMPGCAPVISSGR
jgi:hypothetical protein